MTSESPSNNLNGTGETTSPTGVDVGIVVPTKNGAATLDRLLTAIKRQRTELSWEILAIDSGSTDGTLEVLRTRGARVHEIQPEEFSHSRTRNLGARLARAESYLVFLNQDAIPANDDWLTSLIRPLRSDPLIKAVSAIELDPRAHHPFNVTGIASCAFRNSLIDATYVMSRDLAPLVTSLPKSTARQLYLFTTVCAAFDKSYFDSHPFNPKVEYGEDLHWAVAAIGDGVKVACASKAQVFHLPATSDREYFSRLKRDMRLGEEIFGPGYRSRWGWLAWALGLHRVHRWTIRSIHRLGKLAGGS